MNRKILALILALAAVAAAIVLAVTLNNNTTGDNAPGSTAGEGTDDTSPSIPCVEDSIFNPDPVETREPDETAAPDATQNTTPDSGEDIPIPDGPADPQNPGGDAPGATRPVQTEPVVTEPQQTEPTQPTEPAQTEPVQIPEGEIDYETFTAMDPALQRAYMESFENLDAFFEWYNAAKAAYEQAHPSIDVGDGVIDLEDLFG